MSAQVIPFPLVRPLICWPCVALWWGLAMFWLCVGYAIWRSFHG